MKLSDHCPIPDSPFTHESLDKLATISRWISERRPALSATCPRGANDGSILTGLYCSAKYQSKGLFHWEVVSALRGMLYASNRGIEVANKGRSRMNLELVCVARLTADMMIAKL